VKQEVINAAYGALGRLVEALEKELRNNIDRLERSGDSTEFNAAQRLKEVANLLESESLDMRRKYPHIFNQQTDRG